MLDFSSNLTTGLNQGPRCDCSGSKSHMTLLIHLSCWWIPGFTEVQSNLMNFVFPVYIVNCYLMVIIGTMQCGLSFINIIVINVAVYLIVLFIFYGTQKLSNKISKPHSEMTLGLMIDLSVLCRVQLDLHEPG